MLLLEIWVLHPLDMWKTFNISCISVSILFSSSLMSLFFFLFFYLLLLIPSTIPFFTLFFFFFFFFFLYNNNNYNYCCHRRCCWYYYILTGRMWRELVPGGVRAGRVRSSELVWSIHAAGRSAADETCQPTKDNTTNNWRHLCLLWTAAMVQSQDPDRQYDRDARLCHRHCQIHAYNAKHIDQRYKPVQVSK